MDVAASKSALRRKLGASRPPVAVPMMTLARAWRLALVHGLSEAAGLILTMEDLQGRTIEPIDMPQLMERGDLAILLEGHNGFGVALFDVQFTAALIEAQTMGRVLVRPAASRMPTPTDGAMVADPLDRVLGLFETHARTVEGAETCFGMRFATPLGDGRAVMLALPDEPHVLTEFILSFGGTDRRGRLRLILPAKLVTPALNSVGDPDWQDRIERNLLGAQADLTAVLTRLHLPIERVTNFRVGEMLPISAKALSQVALTTCTGTIVAQGRLGQAGGNKAMLLDRLTEIEPPNAQAPPQQALSGNGVGSLLTGKAPFARVSPR